MSLTRRDSFDLPVVGRVLSQLWNDPFMGDLRPLVAAAEEGTLPLDISEDDRSVYVRASLPGFKKENIDVEVHDGVLSIKAHHEETTEQKGERFYRKERRVGSVSRRVALPGTVVEDQTHAAFQNGVLTLTLPKSAKAMPKKVTIG